MSARRRRRTAARDGAHATTPIREKQGLLRARALALRERALVLVEAFTQPAVKNCVGRLVRVVDDELEWLDRFGSVAPLPRMEAFLPGTTAAVALLERLLSTVGPTIRLKPLLDIPELAQALSDAGAERPFEPPS